MHSLTSSSFFYRFLTTLAVVALTLAGTPVQPAYAATFTVNSTTDVLSNVDGVCTLREAIINSNADANTWTDCGAGTGNDTIVFNIPSATPTITLASTLPNIADPDGVTIDGTNLNGLGGVVTVSGANSFRIVTLNSTIPATFQDMILRNGFFAGNGGAINNNIGNLTVNNVTFQNNSATGNGGAIYTALGGTATVSNSTFANNTAGGGGAIHHNSATLLTITNSVFTSNSILSSNVIGDGGAITLNNTGSSAVITGSTFTSNSAQDDGGAILNNGSSFTVTNSTFQSNSAGNAGASATSAADGGAIRNTTTGTNSKITLSSFINNTISMPADFAVHGAAIMNDGTLIVANVTFSGNTLANTAAGTASSLGGAVYATGPTTVHNSTFSGNSVSENGSGTASGGSIYSTAGAMTIANSIVANGTENGTAGSCGGTFTDGGNNVEYGSSDCGFAITGNPLLGALTGSPAYFPLGAGSSAIDTGSNAICANASTTNNQSQNGVTRPQNGICDIGSYEASNVNTAPTVSAPIADVNVLEDAANTVFSLYPNFADAESSDAQLTFTVTANTNTGLFTSVSITDPTNFTLDYAPNVSGTSNITVRATDPEGLFVEDTFTVTVSAVNDAPTDISLTNASIDENNAINAVIGVLSATDVDAGDTFVFSLTCTSSGADDASFNISGTSLRASAVFDYETKNSYSICIRVTDQGGAGASFDKNFTISILDVNELAPDTTITSNPSNPTSSSSASFSFTGTDFSGSGIASFECSLDGAVFAACTSPQSYTGLNEGLHTFQVRAIDNQSQVDPSPASFAWTISLGFPTLIGSTPANNSTVTVGLTQLKVTFSEDVKNDGSAGAANNIANYLLVENGANNVFNTVSCAGGVVADDTKIAIMSATYSNNGGSGPFMATLTVAALPAGTYRLFVCGTTSIEDLVGNKLNNGLSDATVTFTVAPATNDDGGPNAHRPRALPTTGFPMNQVTALPIQSADKAYASTDLWLEIPKLGVKMTVVGVPFKDGGWDVEWLDKNAGWLNGSAYPTWKGNSVITGHVWDALNKPGPFIELKKLKYGDQIKIHAFGQVYVYEVRASESVSPTDTTKVFKHEEKSWITLLTCEDYKELSQTYSSRRMVRAVLVSVAAEK